MPGALLPAGPLHPASPRAHLAVHVHAVRALPRARLALVHHVGNQVVLGRHRGAALACGSQARSAVEMCEWGEQRGRAGMPGGQRRRPCRPHSSGGRCGAVRWGRRAVQRVAHSTAQHSTVASHPGARAPLPPGPGF